MSATRRLASFNQYDDGLVLAKGRCISWDDQRAGAILEKFSMTGLNSLLHENNSLRPGKNSLRPRKKFLARVVGIPGSSSVRAAFNGAAGGNFAKIPCSQGICPHSGE
jgi:hypothetical protein